MTNFHARGWTAAIALFFGLTSCSDSSPDKPAKMSDQQITITSAWSRETSPSAKNGAAYVSLENNGASDDKIVGVSVSIVRRAEIHNHLREDGVMRMVHLETLDVHSGSKIIFKPGGLHIMLFDLDEPLQAGQTFELVVDFENGSDVSTEVMVLSTQEALERLN